MNDDLAKTDVQYEGGSEAHPDFMDKVWKHLSAEEKRTYEASWAAQKPNYVSDPESKAIIEGDGVKAGYKIEVHFGPDRTVKTDYNALILLMESGKYLNGDGDGQMYLCMDRRILERSTGNSALPFLRATEKKDPHPIHGCGHPIPSGQLRLGQALCLNCKHSINASMLVGQIPFYGSTQQLAEMVEILFRRLKCNADLYCKYMPKDIRYEACAADRIAKLGAIRGMEEARRLRGLMIYPLARIWKDVSSGATLRGRFFACLSS